MLSIILIVATVFPGISGTTFVAVPGGGTAAGAAGYALLMLLRRVRRHRGAACRPEDAGVAAPAARASGRRPPLDELPAPRLSPAKRIWMALLRACLIGAIVQVAAGQ